MNNRLKKILDDCSEHLFFVGATVFSAVIRFLYSVIVKANISPLEYGIYSTCLLAQTYVTYVQLGSLNAFNRDYPQFVGAKNEEKACQYRNNVFTFLVLVYCVVTGIFAFVLFHTKNVLLSDERYTYGLMLCVIIAALTSIEAFLASRVRIDGSFKYTSLVITAELAAPAIGIILIPYIGYYGLYYTTIGSMLIGIVMYWKRGLSDLRFSFNTALLKGIILSGIPLLINNLIWTVVDSIDKFVILSFINTEALGMYSIAQMAFSYMVLIPNAMSQLFYVKMGKIYGATKDVSALNSEASKYTMILAILTSFISLCAFYFIKPVVAWIMPKYSGGVTAAQILILGLAIYSPTTVNSNILTILKKNIALLSSSVYLCVLNIVCSVGLVLLNGPKIESVALGTALSYLIRTIILLYQLKNNAKTNVVQMVKVSVFPVLLIMGLGVVIYRYVDCGLSGLVISIVLAVTTIFSVYHKPIMAILRRN